METPAIRYPATTIRKVRSRNAIGKLEQAFEIKTRLEKEDNMSMSIEVIQELLKENNGDVDITYCISRELACPIGSGNSPEEQLELLVDEVLLYLREGSLSDGYDVEFLDIVDRAMIRDVLIYNGLNLRITKQQLVRLLVWDDDKDVGIEGKEHVTSIEALIEMASGLLSRKVLQKIWQEENSSRGDSNDGHHLVLDRCLTRVIEMVDDDGSPSLSPLKNESYQDEYDDYSHNCSPRLETAKYELTCEDVFEIGSYKHDGIIQLREIFLDASDVILISAYVNNDYNLENTISSLLNNDDYGDNGSGKDLSIMKQNGGGFFSFADALKKEVPTSNHITSSRACVVNGNGVTQTHSNRWQSVALARHRQRSTTSSSSSSSELSSLFGTRAHWNKFRILHVYTALELLQKNNFGIDIRINDATHSIDFYGFKSEAVALSSSCVKIDLHGLLVMEAVNLTKKVLFFYKHNSKGKNEYHSDNTTCTICFIVGRGTHSVGGKARLKPSLTKFLTTDEECSGLIRKIDLSIEGLISVRV